MSDNKLMSRFRASQVANPRSSEPSEPTPAPDTTLTRSEPTTVTVGVKKPKVKSMSWERIKNLVSRETGGFEVVIQMALEISKDTEVEARDRLKAFEFLSKWTEPNPAMTKREVTVSGPDGKPIAVAHAHMHAIARPDLSHLSLEELDAYDALMAKVEGKEPEPQRRRLNTGIVDIDR